MRRYGVMTLRLLSVVALATFAFVAPALADDDDDTEFGAYIYQGTVDDYGDRPVDDAGELDLVRDDDDDDDVAEIWNLIGDGNPAPDPLYGEDDEDIDLTIDELTSEPHVLVVHADEDRTSPVIAIGAIEGEVGSDGSLLIDLDEVNDSGLEGRALFRPDDDDDDDDDPTEVTIGVWEVRAAGV
jgi:hypothetical protein